MHHVGESMAQPLVCRKKIKALTFCLFLIGIAVLSYTRSWWPGIMLAIGIPLAIKQYLLGRKYDMGITLFVFLGVFVSVAFEIQWEILLPVLFTLGGIYIFFRDFLENSTCNEVEREEDMNEEIEEQSH